jgi:hypothetical protein
MSEASPTSAAAAPALDLQLQTMSLVLTREVTCIRSLAWRCDLPVQLPWERLKDELAASGLTSRPAVRGLVRYANPTEDELVLVPASGRVQLRVHYTVPEQERRFAAERLFQTLVYALRRL